MDVHGSMRQFRPHFVYSSDRHFNSTILLNRKISIQRISTTHCCCWPTSSTRVSLKTTLLRKTLQGCGIPWHHVATRLRRQRYLQRVYISCRKWLKAKVLKVWTKNYLVSFYGWMLFGLSSSPRFPNLSLTVYPISVSTDVPQTLPMTKSLSKMTKIIWIFKSF